MVASSRMVHCSHQQLPRWSSKPICVVCSLQPLSQDFPEAALNVATVGLNVVQSTRMESQSQTQAFPPGSYIAELRVDFKQITDVCRETKDRESELFR